MQDYEICPFELRSASAPDYACLNEFKNTLNHEYLPDDPPLSDREAVQRWQSLPAYIEDRSWAAWDSAHRQIVAFGQAYIFNTGDNEHEMDFRIEVRPEARRQGLARRMLPLVVDVARRRKRRLLMTDVKGCIPASDAFLSAIGARRGLEQHFNQLRLRELDRALIQSWLERSAALSSEFRLGWWDNHYPEDRLQELADLIRVLANDMPRDSLDMEDFNYTPEIVREFEKQMLAGGQQHWVLYVADRQSDRIVGLTEVLWNPERPTILMQNITGVLPAFRGRGLGRWLKAEMLNRALRERPQLELVRTGNANSNAPMLKINMQLGFKPYISWCFWQVDTDSVEKYLAAAPELAHAAARL